MNLSLSQSIGFATRRTLKAPLLLSFVYGLLLPLSFAPFHFPGLAILGLSLFYRSLHTHPHPFLQGLMFGLSFFGFGVSWVMVSIHEYGHLNYLLSAGITLSFITYLSVFIGLTGLITARLINYSALLNTLIFAACWVAFEYIRSFLFTGFPWALVGHAQIDSPICAYMPYIGVYGASFITAFLSACLAEAFNQVSLKRSAWLITFMSVLFLPTALAPISWTKATTSSLSVGVIQANLSMRDKWDEGLFWSILERYANDTKSLLGTDLIIWPESAIPLPAHYVNDYLEQMHAAATKAGSAVLIGIPSPADVDEHYYYNAMTTYGHGQGTYYKQHLVPFGEYIPLPFKRLVQALNIPDANLKKGPAHIPLIQIKNHPIASLICYEIAYGHLLRQQLPKGQLIVSLSDDGWFGHSFALYQHLQMAQALSLAAGRPQILANNDGLSAYIDHQGKIQHALPAFSAAILIEMITPRTGQTPWVRFGEWPLLGLICLILSIAIFSRSQNISKLR